MLRNSIFLCIFLPSYVFSQAQESETQGQSSVTKNSVQQDSGFAVSGTVLEEGGNKPVEEAYIFLPALKKQTQTDELGWFELEEISSGNHELIVMREGYEKLSVKIDIPQKKEMKIYLVKDFDSDDEVYVFGRKDRQDTSKKVLKTEELKDLPGSGADAIRAVESLPGVTYQSGRGEGGSSNNGSASGGATSRGEQGGSNSNLVVRGSSPEDTLIFYERVPIPFAYHFGELASIFNTNLIDSIEFYPGGLGVNYGNAMGGVLDIRSKKGNFDLFKGELDLSIFKLDGYSEGPITQDLSFRVAGRRSYFGLAEPFFPDDIGLVVVPFFTDFHLGFDYRIDKDVYLSIEMLNALDGAALSVKSKLANNASGEFDFSLLTSFNTFLIHYQDEKDQNFTKNITPYYVRNKNKFTFGDNEVNFATESVGMDIEINQKISELQKLLYGGNLASTNVTYDLQIPVPPDPSDRFYQYQPLSTLRSIKDTGVRQLSLFFADQFTMWERFSITPGVHYSIISFRNKKYLDPRLSSRFNVADNFRLKASLGQYSQINFDRNFDPELGNPDLPPRKSFQYTFGFEFDVNSDVELQTEVYYKDFMNLPVPDLEGDRWFVAEGKARSYGLELLLKHALTKRFFAWFALTYSVSQDKHYQTGEWLYASFDRPIDSTLVASYLLTPKWKVSTKVILRSGSRETPIELDYYDIDHDQHRPVDDPEKINSEQNPFLYQVDMRTDYDFIWDTWKLGVYLDIVNITMNKIPVDTKYSYDFSEKAAVENFPTIPFVGIKGKF